MAVELADLPVPIARAGTNHIMRDGQLEEVVLIAVPVDEYDDPPSIWASFVQTLDLSEEEE